MTAVNFPNSPSNGDTVTVGGVTYTYNSTKSYWDASTAGTSFDPSTVASHVIPSVDDTYDLGSPSKKWRSIYVDAGTIHIGSQTIKATSSGIQLPEVTIGTGTTTIKLGVDASGNLKQTPTVSGTAGSEVQTVSLTDLSATTASAGTAGLAYNNTTGAFTYTPTDISAKADLAGPALTGTPTAPTASASTNSTQIATTAYADSAVAALVASAPASLDTLNEIAAALGNDAALNTTLTNSIALKAPLASPTFTGVPVSTTPATSDDSTKIATTAYVVAKVGAAGGATTLNGLTDVNTSGVSNGQVLSYTGSAWGVADAGAVFNIAVTVAGGVFLLDGTAQQIASLAKSITYRFDQSHSTNASHPLRFSTTSNGTHGSGAAYTTGITEVGTPGSTGAYTQIVVEQDTPSTLYYYCGNHSGMGGQVIVGSSVSSGGSGGSIELTANGAIGAGKAVVIDTAGTVSQVAATAPSNYAFHGQKFSIGSPVSAPFASVSGLDAFQEGNIWYNSAIDRNIFVPNSTDDDIGIIAVAANGDTTVTVVNDAIPLSADPGYPGYEGKRAQGFYDADLGRDVVFWIDMFDHTGSGSSMKNTLEAFQMTTTTSGATVHSAAHTLLSGSHGVSRDNTHGFTVCPLKDSKYLIAYNALDFTPYINIITANSNGTFTAGTAISPISGTQKRGAISYLPYMWPIYSSTQDKAWIIVASGVDQTTFTNTAIAYRTVDISGTSPGTLGTQTTLHSGNSGDEGGMYKVTMEGDYGILSSAESATVGSSVVRGIQANANGTLTLGSPVYLDRPNSGLSNANALDTAFVGSVGSGQFVAAAMYNRTASHTTAYIQTYHGDIGTNGAITQLYAATSVGQGDNQISLYGSQYSNSTAVGLVVNSKPRNDTGVGKVLIGSLVPTGGFGATAPNQYFWTATPQYTSVSNFSEWVGISKAAVADGATVGIDLPGGINDNQSGMTIEGTYYVQA